MFSNVFILSRNNFCTTSVSNSFIRLRSEFASTDQLLVPSYQRSTIGQRAFPIAGRLWTAFKDRTFSPLLQRCLTVIFPLL